MSKIKITGIVTLIILFVVSIIINGWYLYVKNFGDKVLISETYEIGLQEATDGTTKHFIEVNSFDNCFEVKFNYMLDENQESFYSQGIQIYNDKQVYDKYISFGFSDENFEESGKHLIGGGGLWKDYGYYKYNARRLSLGSFNYYMSGDDFNSTLNMSSIVPRDEFFKVQLGDDEVKDLYLMEMKEFDTPRNKDTFLYSYDYKDGIFGRTDHHVDVYLFYDLEFLCSVLFESLQTLPNGYNKSCVFELGDYFNYYKYDEISQTYTKKVVDKEETELVIEKIKSYYSIKVTKHNGVITKASESLFNCVNGNSNFNITGIESEDYFFGRTLITANNNMFDFVKVSDEHVALKLKQDFIDLYLPYGELIELQVLIDVDEINSLGYEFVGLTNDNGLNNFNVISCEYSKTVDGQIVVMGVNYV